jgi:hypothetical protein
MAARLEYPSTTPGTNSSASGANCDSWERHTILLQVDDSTDDLQSGGRGCHASLGGGRTRGAGGGGGEAAGGEGSVVGGEVACGHGLGWLWAKVAAAWLDPLMDEEEAGVCVVCRGVLELVCWGVFAFISCFLFHFKRFVFSSFF